MSYIIKMALDIKAGFEPPAPMTSPLEAYCAVGTIAKAMKLGMPERRIRFLRCVTSWMGIWGAMSLRTAG